MGQQFHLFHRCHRLFFGKFIAVTLFSVRVILNNFPGIISCFNFSVNYCDTEGYREDVKGASI